MDLFLACIGCCSVYALGLLIYDIITEERYPPQWTNEDYFIITLDTKAKK